MVAASPTSDRQPLQRGCDGGRILRYCQTRNRSNASRDTFRYSDYAFVYPITWQKRAGSQRTNSRLPVSSLLRDRSGRRNSRSSRPYDCSEEHRPAASVPLPARRTGFGRVISAQNYDGWWGDPSDLSAGLYHAAQTLRQTVERDGGAASLPQVDIQDWPTIAYRRLHQGRKERRWR
jgi:hypothetical protein